MSARLLFPDAESAQDALTFAGRATAIDRDAGIHLRAGGGTLAMSTAVLASRGLLDATPTVLALRILPVDPELECDLTVTAAELSAAGASEIALPDTAVRAAWAGVTPPRTGWAAAGEIASAVLAARAQWGMATVSDALPDSPGEDIVRSVRAEVWGAVDAELGGAVRAVAFAAVAMGFVHGEERARVFTAPGWTRLSLQRGHVLVRGPVRSGLTAVRATGS